MQPPFDIPADLDTPVSAWLKLAAFRPRFLLESVEGAERLARYSFLGFGDAVEVALDGDTWRAGGETRAAPRTTAELLESLRAALRLAPRFEDVPPGVPLAGGLVGVLGYDLVRRFETVHSRPPARSAGEPELRLVGTTGLLVFDHLTRRAALLTAGDGAARRGLRADVIGALRGPVSADGRRRRLGPPAASLDRAAFAGGVERVRRAILDGEVYQLVLSVRSEGECEVPPFEVYRALRLLNPSPYMYYLDFGDLQVVGSSPEALVRLEGREAALRPIAGTRPRGGDDDRDLQLERELLADPKESAEHVMLVDLARNDLGRVAQPGSVRVEPSRIVERYSHVMHLVSGVRGVLAPDRDAFDLLAATFPAGTVVGAPKVRAMELIDELEPVGRGLYAGTVGYFGRGGSMDQAIAIRTLTFREGRYAYQAGAGIVSDSDPAREHDEVRSKSAVLARALELAAGGL